MRQPLYSMADYNWLNWQGLSRATVFVVRNKCDVVAVCRNKSRFCVDTPMKIKNQTTKPIFDDKKKTATPKRIGNVCLCIESI